MAEASLLVMLGIVVVAAIVAFKVARSVLQGVLLVSAVSSIILGIAGAVVVRDALDFRDNFQEGSKLMLFSGGDGAKISAGTLIGANESMKPLSSSDVERMSAAFSKGDYAAMKGDNFKLLIIREDAIISSLPEKVDVEGQSVGRELVLQQLLASDTEQRASILASLFGLQLGRNPLAIISNYKNGNLLIYPETPVFQAVKILPEWLFREVGERLLKGSLQEEAVGSIKDNFDYLSSLSKLSKRTLNKS